MTFSKRAWVRTTDVARLRRYKSDDGNYAVECVISLYEKRVRWLAIRVMETGEYMISRCKKRDTAIRMCQTHALKCAGAK